MKYRQIRSLRCFKSALFAVFAALAVMPAGGAAPQGSSPLQLHWPVDCRLGETCWIARYMDRAEGPGKADYLCRPQTEDKHKGTDIAVRDMGAMRTGVSVRAAAAGRVLAIRDGMPDVVVTKERRAKILKQGCGNVIIVGHRSGWRTRYCHLKKGSLRVEKGDRVSAGQIIGQVGLSGITEFPHLHFMVHRNESANLVRHTDPFDGGIFERGCGAASARTENPVWQETIDYVGPVVMPPLVSDTPVSRQTLWQEQAIELAQDMATLYVQARGFHAMPGDVWQFSLTDPDGKVRFRHDVRQRQQRQLVGANARFKQPRNGFQTGDWTATVQLIRDSVPLISAKTGFRVGANQK